VNTGLLGFARLDYRAGSNLEGWTANAGLRLQFNPEPAAVAAPVTAKTMITKAPPIAQPQPISWAGFYVGGFGGAGLGRSHVDFIGDGASDPRIGGFIGGGQVGYNFQFSQYVLGVEGDLGATNVHGSKSCGGVGSPNGLDAGGHPIGVFSPFFLSCNTNIDWLATFAGRVGVTWDRALFYVKGGAAWSSEGQYATSCILGPNQPSRFRVCFNQAGATTNGFSANGNRVGYVLGYGAEFALTPSWSAKSEYNYINFGNRTVTASDGGRLNVGMHFSEVKIGLNYHINTSPAAVFAKN
jgi:opacity protein-like surface antigen